MRSIFSGTGPGILENSFPKPRLYHQASTAPELDLIASIPEYLKHILQLNSRKDFQLITVEQRHFSSGSEDFATEEQAYRHFDPLHLNPGEKCRLLKSESWAL
ncbi:hypothetical protein AVEN_96092-1 [Araneus ventricosus]|uniref:Uncharacterized protein n=1 Tax=Araneus ventricosus TaxID=182803 RepID=A0A4Y2B3D9_ARAVE|nr:hypothetical protein AVEN_96092-1 [Araneus ventricosus]